MFVIHIYIPSEYGQVVMLTTVIVLRVAVNVLYIIIYQKFIYLLRDKGQILIPVGGYVLATPIFILLSY